MSEKPEVDQNLSHDGHSHAPQSGGADSSNQTNAGSQKIFVDEDWKSRVEAEKEEASRKPHAAPAPDAAGQASPAQTEEDADPPLPPPGLLYVAGTMYMQALIGLGLVANPITGKPRVRLNQAQHAIDTLDMLRQKTEGNRTAEESAALDHILHEVRMAFVATLHRQPPQA